MKAKLNGGNKIKTSSRLLIAIAAVLSLAQPISASMLPENVIVQPQWEYVSTTSADISFSGPSGTATAAATRINGVTTKLEGTLTIYRKSGSSWIYVDSISGSTTMSLALELSFTGISGAEYKAVLDVIAYSGSSSESASASDTAICP